MKKLFTALFVFVASGFSLPVLAQTPSKFPKWPLNPLNGVINAVKDTGIIATKQQDLPKFSGQIFAYLWPILGLALVIFIIYAGFLWMTAQGNEENVKKAKEIIKNCLIGLVIILMAYTITIFILSLVK